MFKDKIKLLYFKPSGFEIKWFNYYIQFAIYKKSLSRGWKWFEKIPCDCLNSVGNIYSSLFFHLFIDKVLFEIPKDWNNDDYNKFCSENGLVNFSGKELRAERYRLIKKYMKLKYNIDI